VSRKQREAEWDRAHAEKAGLAHRAYEQAVAAAAPYLNALVDCEEANSHPGPGPMILIPNTDEAWARQAASLADKAAHAAGVLYREGVSPKMSKREKEAHLAQCMAAQHGWLQARRKAVNYAGILVVASGVRPASAITEVCDGIWDRWHPDWTMR
jgi:hypothetical protein